MSTWLSKRLCVDPGRVRLDGEWADVGEGTCERCGVPRRLYSPLVRQDLKVCSACSTIYANRSMQEAEPRSSTDDLDAVPEPGPGWQDTVLGGEFIE